MEQISFGRLLGAKIKELREDGGFTQIELAEESFGVDATGKDRRIRQLENGEVDTPQAKTYLPICKTLNIDKATIRDLKKQAANARQQEDAEFTETIEARGSTQATLNAIPSLSREELENLASRFEIESVYDNTDSDLRQQLTYKAEEYRALKADVDAIPESMLRLANLKAAARDAIARLDLEEVENLLAKVQETELEEAAKTAELRADNALLRGKVDQAYNLLRTAAHSFDAVSSDQRITRILYQYCKKLWAYTLRYGGDGFKSTLDLVAPLVEELAGHSNQKWYADALNWQALALQDQGTRTEGQAGADLLAGAVTAYRAALQVRTRADHPVQWAMTQNNLGIALQEQGIRTDGQAGAELLAEAVTASRAALQVRTRADHPVQWAMTQNNLGNTLRNQGTRTDGQAGAELLAGAVTACRAALQVRTRADHPVGWARTQGNIAIALRAKARHDTATGPRADLDAALAAVDAALTVFDPTHMSYDHGTATKLRDDILADLKAQD